MNTNPTQRGFIPYPTDRVVGTIADAEHVDAGRLSRMPVHIEYTDTVSADAWRSDWPAVPTYRPTRSQQHPV